MMSWLSIYGLDLAVPTSSFRYYRISLFTSYLAYSLPSILLAMAISSPLLVSNTATVRYRRAGKQSSTAAGKTSSDFWRRVSELMSRPGFLSSMWSMATAKYFLMF